MVGDILTIIGGLFSAVLIFGFPVAFVGLFIYAIVAHRKRQALYKKRNFAWYKTNYPTQIRGNRVSCFECGGDRIHVRGLMQRTFTRGHFCTACGTTLYYSPEGH